MALIAKIEFPDEPTVAFDIAAEGAIRTSDGTDDTFTIEPNLKIWANNPTGAAITVTLVGRRKCSQGFLHNVAISVAAAFSGFILESVLEDRFPDASHLCTLQYSVTGMKIGIVRMRRT